MPGRSQYRESPQLVHAVADLARIADVDRIARQSLHGACDVGPADRARDDHLHIGDVEPVACGSQTIDIDIDVAPAGEALGQRRADAGHLLCDSFDRLRHLVDLR